jgi:hypothetical protein
MKTYTLASNGLVYAPGIVRWAISGAAFEKDRKQLINVISSTWSIPEKAAEALLLQKVPYTLVADGAVRFTA